MCTEKIAQHKRILFIDMYFRILPVPCKVSSHIGNMRIADDICDGEFLGLRGTNNGRSCEQHACCEAIVRLNDCVRFKASVVSIDGVDQAGIKAVLIFDGTELSTIGFLGKNIAALKKTSDKFVKKFAQVIEL